MTLSFSFLPGSCKTEMSTQYFGSEVSMALRYSLVAICLTTPCSPIHGYVSEIRLSPCPWLQDVVTRMITI
jgi:hypothetical protein